MNIVFILINLYIGSIIGKYFYLITYRLEQKKIEVFDYRKFILLPFYNLYSKFDKKQFITEVFSIICFILLCLSIINKFNLKEHTNIYEFIFYTVIIYSFTLSLMFIAVYDLLTYSIPVLTTKRILISVLIINLAILIARYSYFRMTGDVIFEKFHLGEIGNLLSGSILALFTWSLIKLTNNQGMGEGDIDITMIVGLFLGWPLTLSAYFFITFLGGVIAILYSIYLGKYKGVVIPFVPIILLGTILSYGYGMPFFDRIFSEVIFF